MNCLKKMLLSAAIIGLLGFPVCGQTAGEEAAMFIVANDLHYLSPALLGDGSYFSEPKGMFDGKTVHYSAVVTDAFFAEVIEKKPQALILAGDLTLNGAYASHKELAQKLSQVKAAGIDVLVIPGNHDVDRAAADYSSGTLRKTAYVRSQDFASHYEKLLPDSLVSRDGASFSYIYKAGETLWILMLDTNTHGQGFVKEETLKWLEAELDRAAKLGVNVVSVTHQNLYAHSDLISRGFVIDNADKLLALYERYGVRCNLSGHIHIQSIVDGRIPEMVTSSLCVTGNHYGELVCSDRQLTYAARPVDVAGYAKKTGQTDPHLLDFADYAAFYFEEVTRNQSRDALEKQGLLPDVIERMVDAYARINAAYFRGERMDDASYREELALWHAQSGFVPQYIASMIAADGEKKTIEISFP